MSAPRYGPVIFRWDGSPPVPMSADGFRERVRDFPRMTDEQFREWLVGLIYPGYELDRDLRGSSDEGS